MIFASHCQLGRSIDLIPLKHKYPGKIRIGDFDENFCQKQEVTFMNSMCTSPLAHKAVSELKGLGLPTGRSIKNLVNSICLENNHVDINRTKSFYCYFIFLRDTHEIW